jgi:ferredoxin
MLTSAHIKDFARDNGADLVGIGAMDRFAGTAPEKDPRFIAPRARSVIGLGFRVLRGALRGVEEQTHFYQLPEMGIVHIDEIHAPTVLRRVACLLEDHGFEGVVQRSVPDRRRGEDSGTNPERVSTFTIRHSDAVAPNRPAPDVLLDFNQAAQICGLGEVGLGGFVLTPRFGPLQRFAFILTDAELDPDPVAEPALCDHCGACVAACPGSALTAQGELDEWQCAAYRLGADANGNPFLDPEAVRAMPDGAEALAGTKRFDAAAIQRWTGLWHEAYPPVRFGYNPALCGLACQRACLAHLERCGVLQDKFANPFRGE